MEWTTLTKDEKFEKKVEKYCKWHRWFAWYPIVMYDRQERKRVRVWLQFVGRKLKIVHRGDEVSTWLALAPCRYCRVDEVTLLALSCPEIVDSSGGEYERMKLRLAEYHAGRSEEWQQ